MEKEPLKPHAVVIPLPLQGHVTPAVGLAIKLASKGFIITFVNTHLTHHHMTKAQKQSVSYDIFSEVRESGLDIRYTTISDGFPLSFDRSINLDQSLEGLLHVFSAHVDELVAQLIHSNPPITCLITDTLFVWPSKIAKKYNLVNVSFWTEPALVFNIYYHLDLLRSNGHFGSHDNREDIIGYLPGVKAIDPKDLMSYLQDDYIGTAMHRYMFKSFEDVKETDIVVCNTVQDLEKETISALVEKKPTYAIGPIFPDNFSKRIVTTTLWPESECSQWLDTKPHGSVLYVSFGSLAFVSRELIADIAHALILSKVSFIWVLRPGILGSDKTDPLPDGFEDEVRDRGLVVPWCCQVAVISNPAVGGFLTHCGWNSILESMWCGVPMLCFPFFSDQTTNRKLVVHDWQIGCDLCDRKVIRREEIAEKIDSFMTGKVGDEPRKNIKEMRKMLENALSAEGSSEKNFNQFINDVKSRIEKRQRTQV